MSPGERRSPPVEREANGAADAAPNRILERCEHAYQRPSADNDLAICIQCGRIVGGLTRAGEIELIALSVCWGGEPGEIGDGGDDYAIRVPVRRGGQPAQIPSRNGHDKAKWGAVAV